ncbi:hypothetical protein J2T12_002568 [Paenibacillus anaericanus]|uniref:GYF domain-containing protein n=1 Tax=Paenibacillus anaericanus TaxID=170367 RepID=UPI00277D79C8|nr:GYF domain-containing protein [Paenibacillus anaericanus]MDQ0089158.1 hypothetical protein [Paenibacillus anaericanus]
MFCSKCGEEKKNSICPNCGNTVFTPHKLKDLKWDKPKESENRTIFADTSTSDQEAEKWYYVLRGERYGPVSRPELLNLYKSEKIFLSTKVWKAGMSGWVDVNHTDLIDKSNQPPPLQGDDINNTLVWVLAFIPIIGPLLEYIISGAIGETSGSLWFITTIINTILCIIDERKLKKAGYNTKEMLLWAIFIVPVYLFRRAHLLKQKNVYAVVWCITFAIMVFAPTWVSGITGISNPNAIERVQDGTLNSYPNKTVSQMVDNYFLNPKWEAFVGGDRNTYVNVTGEITYQGKQTNVLIQYKLNNDRAFVLNSMEFDGVLQNMTTYTSLMNSMYDE